jgi:hypothetical protein
MKANYDGEATFTETPANSNLMNILPEKLDGKLRFEQ